jgi:hypothetical protein
MSLDSTTNLTMCGLRSPDPRQYVNLILSSQASGTGAVTTLMLEGRDDASGRLLHAVTVRLTEADLEELRAVVKAGLSLARLART